MKTRHHTHKSHSFEIQLVRGRHQAGKLYSILSRNQFQNRARPGHVSTHVKSK